MVCAALLVMKSVLLLPLTPVSGVRLKLVLDEVVVGAVVSYT